MLPYQYLLVQLSLILFGGTSTSLSGKNVYYSLVGACSDCHTITEMTLCQWGGGEGVLLDATQVAE